MINAVIEQISHPWKPILPEDLKKRAKEALVAIFDSLPSPDDERIGPSLSVGHAGTALLHGYAALADPDPRKNAHLELAIQHINYAISSIGVLPTDPWLYSGYSGIAWVVDHFINVGLIDNGDADDLNESIDEELLSFLSISNANVPHELIAGISGIGIYGLDRRGRGLGDAIVDKVIEILLLKAENSPCDIAWFDNPDQLHPLGRKVYPNGAFNLGVSHGNPGVAGFLAEAASRGNIKALEMLNKSLKWINGCKDLHEDGSHYGAAFGRGEKFNIKGSRIAWCYGDLGISCVFMLAAKHTNNHQLEQEALYLAHACVQRHDPFATIKDAGICHGFMGNAHLFARLYNATGETDFKEFANEFYIRGLASRRDVKEAGGFMAYLPPLPGDDSISPWVPMTGLLEGCTGIGLTLLAATTSVEPLWDRILLSHIPPINLEQPRLG